jgi:hypothetical protein
MNMNFNDSDGQQKSILSGEADEGKLDVSATSSSSGGAAIGSVGSTDVLCGRGMTRYEGLVD